MIGKWIEFSIRNPLIVIMISLALGCWGIFAAYNTPIDAIPDLGENQVIVFADWPGRSPREIEDQVTYPLSRKLQGLAGVRTLRSSSEFNFSMITVIFEDKTNFYFARQRVLERLAENSDKLPTGVTPYLAPDATSLGQIYWYTVEPTPGVNVNSSRLWGVNKFLIAPQINSAPGVAEVASVGGMPMEYQIDVNPENLRSYGVSLGELFDAVSRSNQPAGGGVIQKNNAEYIVRGIGWIRGKEDIENTLIKEVEGTPIYVKTIAAVQIGTRFRRGVFEKNGSEVVGGVVLMRYGENPLAVTARVKEKIRQLLPSLPAGVRIVPAYDRTRLIEGAINTLAEVMWHEMVIAAIAIILILGHIRSVFVICITLPLSVLFSFSMMWILRSLGIIDIQANIMSLAGITISIGVLVDQAIVMVENASHHLKEKFGKDKIAGENKALIIKACVSVGRPIFFSIMIMLLSFIPVFLLSGREGKLFHPLAYTKSFALIGTALFSVTLVPALIPLLIRGRLRSEQENLIVRSFISIYKPFLSWFMPRINLVMWMFAALLILAAGIFPLQALVGMGASETAWQNMFLAVLAIVTTITVMSTIGGINQIFSLITLIALGVCAHGFPKIGVAFMPALDEGTTLDMPVTIPRASVTQVIDDLKARDALIRGFPEVESVVGKAGRADTPTDPSPLDMVETFINFRPREFWPRRVLKYNDGIKQATIILSNLEKSGFISKKISADDRSNMLVESTQKALERFDEVQRELATSRFIEMEASLASNCTRELVSKAYNHFVNTSEWIGPKNFLDDAKLAELEKQLSTGFGLAMARHISIGEIEKELRRLADFLTSEKLLTDPAAAMKASPTLLEILGEKTTGKATTLADRISGLLLKTISNFWQKEIQILDRELFYQGTSAFIWLSMEELFTFSRDHGFLENGTNNDAIIALLETTTSARLGQEPRTKVPKEFEDLVKKLEPDFQQWALMWKRMGGPRGDLVDDEMGRVLQVPGWSNIFTQPIINRIEMLSSGIRTDVGIKVFGPDLATIDKLCKEVERSVRNIRGARDVVAGPIMGKGYLEIEIDREKAARFGVSVEDAQLEIEMAIGGRNVTSTVENRERYPVRVRYSRIEREDENAVRKLLVTGSRSAKMNREGEPLNKVLPGGDIHKLGAAHLGGGLRVIPLSAFADIRITEGPAMIKSENGQMMNAVTLNVRGRDMVGFIEEARRVVEHKINLPEGYHLEWSGEFEHQLRAAKTLLIAFPAVILLIFIILYFTYKDLADASLIMLTLPEALAGGAFFLFFFPKIQNGWDSPPFDFSVAVWVGFIACFGMAAETGIIMMVYLREAIEKRGGLENIKSLEELKEVVLEGAVHRLRPKLLTEGVAILAIFPMVFSQGVGSEILAPMALPVLGGLLISDEVVDLFLPVRFFWVRKARWLKLREQKSASLI
ncbi:MAG: efflux RND transporter permease subunit [Planctomycetes bacterium]|nr:efflux RND transporter permease subunit [Planctomycetota bacterium]